MGWTTPSDRSTGDTITSAIWNENVGASGNSALLKTSVNNSGALSFVDATELTIASGVITVTQNYHKVDVETGSTDDVTTITAGANIVAGHVLHLRVESDARTVVLKASTSGAANLEIGSDVTLDEAYKTYSLVYDGTNWRPFTFAESPTFASLSPLTTRGDLLYGSSGTPTGARLAVGGANTFLASDGTDVSWGSVSSAVTNYAVTQAQVVNTTSSTAFVTFTVPADTWAAGDVIRVFCSYLLKNNSGGSSDFTWYYGVNSDTQAFEGARSVGNSATIRTRQLMAEFHRVVNDVWSYDRNASSSVPQNTILAGDSPTANWSTPAFDSDITVTLKIVMGVANANTYITPSATCAYKIDAG